MNATHTGRLIAQARKGKQLTQKNLSQALHVSVQAVSKCERRLSQSKPARRQTMAVRWSSDPHAPSPFLTYDAVFNGAAWRGILDSQDIPYLAGGYAAGLLEAQTAVSHSGTVPLCLSLDAGRGAGAPLPMWEWWKPCPLPWGRRFSCSG